jgi:hypothetical protein
LDTEAPVGVWQDEIRLADPPLPWAAGFSTIPLDAIFCRRSASALDRRDLVRLRVLEHDGLPDPDLKSKLGVRTDLLAPVGAKKSISCSRVVGG